jgi:hypothetical protein
MQYLHNVLGFFFGSVRRAGWSLAGLMVAYFAWRPHDLQRLAWALFHDALAPAFHAAVAGILAAVAPIIQPAVTIFIIYLAFLFLHRKARGR